MKVLTALIIVSLFILGCSEEKQEVKDPFAIKNKSSADLPKGGIPYEITFYSDFQKQGQTIDDHVNILKDYKIMYGDQIYYNNLFQISLSYLHLEENLSGASDENVEFLLDEFTAVESNMVNIESIPILLNEALKRALMTHDEMLVYSKTIFNKNLNEIDGIKWSDEKLRQEKIKEVEAAKLKVDYYRGRVDTHLLNTEKP